MSRVERNRATLTAFACLLAALTVAVALAGSARAVDGELVVQPSVGAPAKVMLGASPAEAAGEAWATARGSDGGYTLARYTDAGGWEVLPPPVLLASGGRPIIFNENAGVGRATPGGAVVVAGEQDVEGDVLGTLVVRDPGGQPRQAADPTPLLEAEAESQLFGLVDGQPLLVAREESGRAGALVVPESLQRVLRYDGQEWTSEAIEPLETGFHAVAIDAAAGDAWLLGTSPGHGLELFRRQSGGGGAWVRQELGPPGSLGARLEEEAPGGVGVAPRSEGQPLTATAAGVWIDFSVAGAGDATAYFDAAAGEVTGSWCGGPAALCTAPLEYDLPAGQGRSFAWVPDGASGPFGTRIVTGVGAGAVLSLEGETFRRLTFVGGDAGSNRGAALSSPEAGWLGASPPLQLTRNPSGSGLQSWPLPFRRPLTAVAAAPGAGPALGAEALAVGENGQVARYVPGAGWEPEALLRSSGKRATPTLRGVAWPEPGFAYAVGDNGAMWRWQRATGLWQADPGAPPNLARANFTAIAFDPDDPTRGFAVGKQGLLLGYGREWQQETLPSTIPKEADFSSVAFAGGEAIATWKYPLNLNRYRGGVIVNDGSGWRVDEGATAALGGAVPQRVAGLRDGGALIATLTENDGQNVTGRLLVRQGKGAAWQESSSGLPGYPVALAAIREGDLVRALIAVSSQLQGQLELSTDVEQILNQPPPGQAPLLTSPYPLPSSGVMLRQTATGWRDEQRQQFPTPPNGSGQTQYDLPVRPDPVLALLASPDGSVGWAVGGETATSVTYLGSQVQTAYVARFGAGAAPPANSATAAIEAPAGAVFAIGGNAQCAAACADYAGAGLGPDRWLPAAVSRAATVPGVRAFLYTGAGVAATDGRPNGEVPLAKAIAGGEYLREQAAYARRLAAGAGSLPVFAAASESDLDAGGSLEAFRAAFASFGQPFGGGAPGAGVAPLKASSPGSAYYSFDSTAGAAVRVIVLDYSLPALGDPQRCWLAQELAAARAAERPAIVLGQRDLAGLADNAAADRTQVVQTLVGLGAPAGCAVGQLGAASAYFFDYPQENRAYRLSAGGRGISTYGSGTLGYVDPPAATDTQFAGASGFLLVGVRTSERDPTTNAAPVEVRLVPSIGSLALDPTDGTLLRRSQPALFEALARRSLAGSMCEGASANTPGAGCEILSPPPYVPIPTDCQGGNCASSLFPEYTFTSSRPDIADFVASDPASSNPRNVLLVKKKPVLDSHSGLLCAFNAGTTTVTVTAGGLSYSQKVTVQAGTVQQPCGTTPLRERESPGGEPETPPGPSPTPNEGPLPNDTPPPPPPPPPPALPQSPAPPSAKPTPPAPAPPPTYFPLLTTAAVPLVPIVPPPPLPAVQPTPPSGTSQVNAVEEEEEPEEAIESSSAMVALPSPGPARAPLGTESSGGGVPLMLPAAAILLALAAATIGGSTRPRRRPRPAFQTNSNRRYR